MSEKTKNKGNNKQLAIPFKWPDTKTIVKNDQAQIRFNRFGNKSGKQRDDKSVGQLSIDFGSFEG